MKIGIFDPEIRFSRVFPIPGLSSRIRSTSSMWRTVPLMMEGAEVEVEVEVEVAEVDEEEEEDETIVLGAALAAATPVLFSA
jgi:hypothetical protein